MKNKKFKKDKCIKHGLTDVILLPGKGNFACILCIKELQSFKRGIETPNTKKKTILQEMLTSLK